MTDRNSGGRPLGALHPSVLRTLEQRPTGATWREVADVLRADAGRVRETMNNLYRAGHLQIVDRVPVHGARRPMRRLAVRSGPGTLGGSLALADTLRGWRP